MRQLTETNGRGRLNGSTVYWRLIGQAGSRLVKNMVDATSASTPSAKLIFTFFDGQADTRRPVA